MSGVIAGFVVYPADVVKTFLTMNQGKSKSVYTHVKGIYRTSGIGGFYKGLVISSVGIAPFIGLRMSTYEKLLFNPTINAKINKHPQKKSLKIAWNMISGCSAGFSALVVLYPGDVLRRLS